MLKTIFNKNGNNTSQEICDLKNRYTTAPNVIAIPMYSTDHTGPKARQEATRKVSPIAHTTDSSQHPPHFQSVLIIVLF